MTKPLAPTTIGERQAIADLRDNIRAAIANAFVAGCEAVHADYQEDRDPDFSEAASDYATDAIGVFDMLHPQPPTTNAPVADLREAVARLCLRATGFEYEGDSLCDEADRLFVEVNPRIIKAVKLADEFLALRQTLPIHGEMREALEQAITLIDEINERKPSRIFWGIGQSLHAKLCTIRATLARNALQGDGL